jgi:hypothetical protein
MLYLGRPLSYLAAFLVQNNSCSILSSLFLMAVAIENKQVVTITTTTKIKRSEVDVQVACFTTL